MARVLVVEDSPDQARLIAGLLEADGHTAEIAVDGESALEAMTRNPAELVVTDLMLPGLSGLDVVEALKQSHPLVPVILMTAYGSGEIAAQALDKGAASYVPKRRIQDELVPTVNDTLSVAHSRREKARMMEYLESVEYRFSIDNDPALIPALVDYVQEGVRERTQRVDDTELMQTGIALHEALINAMHHGNLEVGSELRESEGDVYRKLIEQRLNETPYRNRRVHVTLHLKASELTCVIRDEGPGFDPSSVPDPTDPSNLQRVSGRGLYLIWTFMDRVSHNDAGNEITLVKRIPVAGESP